MNYLKALKLRIATSVGLIIGIVVVMFIYNNEITLNVAPLLLLIISFIVYLIISVWMDIKYADLNSIWKLPLWQIFINIAVVLSLIIYLAFQDSTDSIFIPVLPLLYIVNYLIDDMRRYKLYVKYGLDENQDAYYLGKTHPEVIHNMSKKYRDYFSDVGEIEKKDNIIE